VPPTPGLETLDPAIHLDVVRDRAREAQPRTVLSTASGFGGVNAALLLNWSNQ
jgi:3-oxoacyl-(acyl-carrier-protein) synthase